jgi:putative nucleotidyltransferase with HDIG domain
MISLETLSQEIDRLNPASASLPRLAELMSSSTVNLNDIIEVIEYDPVITANSIRLANSAYFASSFQVYTVRDAVQKVGAGRILEYSMGGEVMDRMKSACPGYGLVESELWEHSLAAATAASFLHRFTQTPIHPASFTAALLHDFGKIIISRYLDAEILQLIHNYVIDNNATYVNAETAVLGFNHAQIGGVVAHRWRFPETLVNSITWHHEPRIQGRADIVLDAVHVCNTVAKTIGVGIGTEAMNMAASAEAASALGLNPSSLEALCALTQIRLPEVISVYGEHTDVV